MTRANGNASASRRHPRARVNLPARLTCPETSAEGGDGLCTEISIGGMRVVHDHALKPGTQLGVEVGTFETPLELEARVVWSAADADHHLLGLAFENLESAQSPLADLVAKLRAQRSWGPGL